MRHPDLPSGKRLTAARVAGAVSRLSAGGAPVDQAVAELYAISRDPEILGHELGRRLGEEYDTAANRRAIEMLRAADADEDVAGPVAEWQREQAAVRNAGPR
jgi:hypothetical protein